VQADYQRAFEQRRKAALALIETRGPADPATRARQAEEYRAAQGSLDAARTRASRLVEQSGGEKDFSDTNYIFLTFVTQYLPTGLVGLLIAVVFAATMSASSGEINSLATVTVVDLYKRYIVRDATDHHYLWASRVSTLLWGACAV